LPPQCLMKVGTENLEVFRKMQTNPRQSAQPNHNGPIKWSKPLPGRIKLNWDAALDRTNKVMGVGVIARDHEGSVKASKSILVPYVSDPAIAEALGAQKGVEFGLAMGFHSIDLEGDARDIITTLGRDNGFLGKYGSLIADAREKLRHFRS